MKKNNIYLYIVEGDCEEHALTFLKNNYVQSGKVVRLNPLQKEISQMILRNLKENTIAILIFDTDTLDGTEVLEKNKKILKRSKQIKDIILVPQVKNFEEELIRACNIKKSKSLPKVNLRKILKEIFLAIKIYLIYFKKIILIYQNFG